MMRRNLLSWLVLAPLIVLAGLLYALWVWTGVDTSLANALNQASRYLPAGQTLLAQDVHGSLRGGGRIGHLRWERDGLVMDARQVELAWSPAALLQRRLQLDKLHIAQLTIDDQSPAATASAPQGVALPFRVSLAFIIDELHWTGPPALQASALSGRYRFDGNHHQLTIDGVQIAAGQYHAQASLLARAPLTLDLQVQGALTAPVPGSSQTLPLVATASAHGNLAGQDAVLSVQALLQPAPAGVPPAAGSTASHAMQATVSAQVRPWSPQPVLRADATSRRSRLSAGRRSPRCRAARAGVRPARAARTSRRHRCRAIPLSPGPGTRVSVRRRARRPTGRRGSTHCVRQRAGLPRRGRRRPVRRRQLPRTGAARAWWVSGGRCDWWPGLRRRHRAAVAVPT